MRVAESEDPQRLFEQGAARNRDLQKKAKESQERAEKTRQLRIANGFDKLIADLLGGRI